MAQRTYVELTDDLDGSPAEETVSFGLGKVDYDIDLSGPNARALRDALAPYVEKARRVGRTRADSRRAQRAAARGATTADREQSKAVRSWARNNGWPDLGSRGRIPEEVTTAYHDRAGWS